MSGILKVVQVHWRRLEDLLGRRRLLSLVLGLAILSGAIVLTPGAGRSLDRFGIDTVERLAMDWRPPHPDLAIVAIDTDCLAAVPERWPWPRDQYARLLEAIASAQPAIIVLDLVLQHGEVGDGGVGDETLARTLQRLGNVHLVSMIATRRSPEGFYKRHFRSDQRFRDAAAGEGFVWALEDDDGVVRSFVLEDSSLGKTSCVLQLSRKLRPATPALPSSDAEGVSSSLLAFARRGGEIPVISAREILRGQGAAAPLAGRIVFVGVSAPVLHDYHLTCRGPLAGSRILAQSLDTILSDRVVEHRNRPFWRLLMGFLGVIGGAGSLLLLPNRPFTVLLAGMISAALGWAAMFLQGGLCLPLFPLVGGWFLAGGLAIGVSRLMTFVADQDLRAEARAAGTVQGLMMPTGRWEGGGYSCLGICRPCSAAGGDFFDMVALDKDDMLFLVTDVAGHGIGAAMVVSILKAVIATLQVGGGLTLGSVVEKLNAVLVNLFPKQKKRVVTGVFCRLELPTHRLTMISAGHMPAMLVRRTGQIEEVKFTSPPLGFSPKFEARQVALNLDPGDTLVLYSDGIIETVDWNLVPLGFQPWRQWLAETAGQPPDKAMLEHLLARCIAYANGREADDDVTLLMLHRFAPVGDSGAANGGRS